MIEEVNTKHMTLDQFNKIVSMFQNSGIKHRAYPQTFLINAEDRNGVIQSYYASTGTAIFRDTNDKYRQKRTTCRDMPVSDFIKMLISFKLQDITEDC